MLVVAVEVVVQLAAQQELAELELAEEEVVLDLAQQPILVLAEEVAVVYQEALNLLVALAVLES
jgi:hypothetical protein